MRKSLAILAILATFLLLSTIHLSAQPSTTCLDKAIFNGSGGTDGAAATTSTLLGSTHGLIDTWTSRTGNNPVTFSAASAMDFLEATLDCHSIDYQNVPLGMHNDLSLNASPHFTDTVTMSDKASVGFWFKDNVPSSNTTQFVGSLDLVNGPTGLWTDFVGFMCHAGQCFPETLLNGHGTPDVGVNFTYSGSGAGPWWVTVLFQKFVDGTTHHKVYVYATDGVTLLSAMEKVANSTSPHAAVALQCCGGDDAGTSSFSEDIGAWKLDPNGNFPLLPDNKSVVAIPTFSPDGGSSNSVTLTDGTSGASITYCSNVGGDCNPVGGTVYSGTISITQSSTHICAYGRKSGLADSGIHCANFSPVGGVFKLGDTSIEPNDDGGTTTNKELGFVVTTPNQTTSVNDCVIRVGSTTGHYECAIYTNSGGLAASKLCSSPSTNATSANSWLTIPISGCGTLSANTQYWVFFNTDTASYRYNTGLCGHSCLYDNPKTYGTWDDPMVSSPSQDVTISGYIEVQ